MANDTPVPTLAAWLDEWMILQRTRLEPATWRSYDDMSRIYLRPALGDLRLDELTVRGIEAHYVTMLASGGRRGRGLSRRTIGYTHAVLHKALADAVRLKVIGANVADRVTLPRVDGRDSAPERLHVWDADQVQTFLELTRDDPHADLWRVAVGTGMRRGELLGLRFVDIDMTVPQLQVAAALTLDQHGRPILKRPKTNRTRTLHLDADTAYVLARQRDRGSPLGTVFTRTDGTPWHPAYITDRWRTLVRTLPLPTIRLHDLRHTHATLLLAAGVPVKVVSERLGHTTIWMTLDVYAHVLPAQDRNAAEAIGTILRPAA